MAKVCTYLNNKPGFFFGNQTKSSKGSKENPDTFVEVEILDLKEAMLLSLAFGNFKTP